MPYSDPQVQKEYWRDRHLLKYDPEKERWRTIWKKYKLTKEAYLQLVEKQGGGCAICGLLPKTRPLAVDHDHACCPGRFCCGKCVRGLLCFGCNAMLGRIKDNPDRLVLYLKGGPDALPV